MLDDQHRLKNGNYIHSYQNEFYMWKLHIYPIQVFITFESKKTYIMLILSCRIMIVITSSYFFLIGYRISPSYVYQDGKVGKQ